MKKEIWVIGDVYGELDLLKKLINKLPKNADICFTGIDLIDRGGESLEVIKFIMQNGYDCVSGNHEIMMNRLDYSKWLRNGGQATIDSFDRGSKLETNKAKEFISSLPYFNYYNFKNHIPLVVSHSYIHNIWNGEDFAYDERVLLDTTWRHMKHLMQFNLDKESKNNIYNIFGHTIIKKPIIYKHWTMIDTGAYKSNGALSAISYPSLNIISVKKETI